jgi:hypothetical protein
MNRITVALAIIIFTCTTTTHAQLLRGYGLKLGTVAAYQSWKYSSFPDLPTETRWGFTGVGFLEFFDLPLLSVVAELQYTQKGMTLTLPVYSESDPEVPAYYRTNRPRVDYLSIPILAKVRFTTPLFEPYLIAGPRWDLLLSKKPDGFDVVIDRFETSEFSATLGIGFELSQILPIGVMAEFRYNPSFRDAFNNNFLTVRNRSLDFLLGVRL